MTIRSSRPSWNNLDSAKQRQGRAPRLNLRLYAFAALLPAAGFGQTPFWQEDFSSQTAIAANWQLGGQNEGSETWKWDNHPALPMLGQVAFEASTAGNGFMVFNSDLNGPHPHAVTLTTPPIDCSGHDQVYVAFQNQYLYYSEEDAVAEVGVSTDGVDFQFHQVLLSTKRFAFEVPVENVFVPIPEAANQPAVYLQFKWIGNFEYFWKLDDLALFDEDPRPANDLFLDEGAIPTAYATPVSQADSVFFAVVAGNAGKTVQTGVAVEVRVLRNDTLLFDLSEQIPDLAPGQQDTVFWDSKFLPDRRGIYKTIYSVSQDQEELWPPDNRLQFQFVVTEALYSVDNGTLIDAIQPPGLADPFWEVGNYYHVKTSGFRGAEGVFSIASVDNAHIGKTVGLHVYQVIPDDDPSDFTDGDLFPVGYGEYTFHSGDASYDLFTAPLYNFDDNEPGISLQAGSDYIVSLTLTDDLFIPYSVRRQYYDIATVVRNGKWFLGGFGADVAAMVRLEITPEVSATRSPEAGSEGLLVFPQPAAGFCRLKWQDPPTGKVHGVIISAGGALVSGFVLNPTADAELNLAGLPDGPYWLHLTDGTKRWVRPLMIHHP